MTKLRYLSIPGVLLAAALTVTACGSPNGGHNAADPGPASTSRTPAAAPTHAASPTASPASSSAPGSDSSGQTTASVSSAFTEALAQWKDAAYAPLATINTYLLQAASDLRGADDPGYATAIGQLTYMGHVPDSNATPTQIATSESDAKALDKFFGTPGLNS